MLAKVGDQLTHHLRPHVDDGARLLSALAGSRTVASSEQCGGPRAQLRVVSAELDELGQLGAIEELVHEVGGRLLLHALDLQDTEEACCGGGAQLPLLLFEPRLLLQRLLLLHSLARAVLLLFGMQILQPLPLSLALGLASRLVPCVEASAE